MNHPEIGMKNQLTALVGEDMLACTMGSGTLRVLATPAVLALMEKAACEMIQPFLEEGITTVGTDVKLEHISATPAGAEVRVEAVLVDIADRKYSFEITAYDNAGVIARARHERFAVKSERFIEKTYSKL